MRIRGASRASPAASAYLLLTVTALLWAGNAVTSRWAPGHVSPQVITTLRWAVACLVLMPLAGTRSWPLGRSFGPTGCASC